MKILIAADMEGICGVVHWDQVNPKHPEYSRFRKLMTEDVNAAIRGAFSAGADEVVVTDGHNAGRNILIEELDPRARLNSGTPSPLEMVEGVQNGADGVCFIGYHARIGTPRAILEHTWSDDRVTNLWLKGANETEFRAYGEIGLNAAVCGHFGVPILMISGDQAACDEACQLLGPIETAVVKQATGRMAAECLSPAMAGEKIQQAAYQAVVRLRTQNEPTGSFKIFNLQAPITMAIDLVQSEMADNASLMPGTRRSGRRIEYTGENMVAIYQAFRTAVSLAG
jgi:D-amino peptidase